MAQLTDPASHALGTPPDEFLESLGRLSKKPGVLATIVLERKSGTILSTTGSLASSRVSTSSNPTPLTVPATADDPSADTREVEGVEQMAVTVWNFVNASSELVQGLDKEDEVKLLRLRTKKYELVIVPDPKYLLIAVHETSIS